MNTRNAMLFLIGAALAQGISAAAEADALEMVVPTKAGVSPANAVAEIKVDGESQDGPYDTVRNKTLDYIVGVRGDPHKKSIGAGSFAASLVPSQGGERIGGTIGKAWKYYALSSPYVDPRASNLENVRVSPVALCNARLQATSGQARKMFLKHGETFAHKNAYEIAGEATTEVSSITQFSKFVTDYERITVPVKITCMPLDRPRPRTETSTRGVDPKPGQKMKPTIAEATLEVKPASIEQMGKYLCPTKLKLYGHLETIRAFTGKSLFVGPHYLSSVTEIAMADAGTRNMVGTYDIAWHKMGGLAAAPEMKPKNQTLTFRFNIANKDGKLLESAERIVEVSCRKIEVNVPAASGDMTIKPAN